ncbi:hypothetical protein F5X99DRAFT_98625 [Biscogniauxia marginata]|nr:hypothetical protein F5X99DRAFT_98625 [Biscogniauxia marginata]
MAVQDPDVSTESNGGGLVTAATMMLVLSWCSVFLRSYTRAFLTKCFQVDDWLMLTAQINFTVSCAFILRGVTYGVGRHNKSLSQDDEIEALMYQALATATYILNMLLIKLSIGIFLLRLAMERRYKYTIYISLGIITIWSLVLFFWNLFQCNPFAAQWDYTILQKDPSAHCVSAEEIVNAAYALSVMTVLSDWLYALLPIPMIWNVKMTVQAKATVIAVLGLGIFASIATLIRLKFLSDLEDTSDILFKGTDAMIWTLIEPGIAISAASLVTIRPLLRKWKLKGFTSTGSSRQTAASGENPASRTHHSNKMPGFGSQDITLVDIELGNMKGHKSGAPSEAGTLGSKSGRSRLSHILYMKKVAEDPANEVESRDEPLSPTERRSWMTQARSDIFFIEGASSPIPPPPAHDPHARGTWLEQDSSSSSSSLDLITTPTSPVPADYAVGLASPYRPLSYQRPR